MLNTLFAFQKIKSLSFWLLYAIVLGILYMNAEKFFPKNPGYYSGVIIAYCFLGLIFSRYSSAQTTSFFEEIRINWLYYIAVTVIFLILPYIPRENTGNFLNGIIAFLWFYFVVGFTESIIWFSVQEKIGNFWACVIVAFLHIGRSAIYLFSGDLVDAIIGIFKIFIGFFLFSIIYFKTNSINLMAYVHALYDMTVLGYF